MSEELQSPVSNAFRNPPAMAGYFKERAEDLNNQMNQEAVSQDMGAYSPDPNANQPLSFPQQQAAPAPQPAPVPDNSYNEQIQARLMTERNALAKQVQDQQQQLAAYADAYSKLRDENAEKLWEKELSEYPEMEQLEAVDPDDARRIAKMTAKALSRPLVAMQQEIERQKADAQNRASAYQANLENMRQVQRAREVLSEHPDFFDMYQKDPGFKQFLDGHEGGSSWSREQMALAELNRGNSRFVADMISRYKQSRPGIDSVRGVPPVQVARGTGYSTQRQAQPGFTLHDLNNLIQTRQISHDQYRAMLKELRGAGGI